MNKHFRLTAIVIMLVLTVVTLAGCSTAATTQSATTAQSSATTNASTTSAAQTTTAKTSSTTASTSSAGALSAILGKAAGIASMKYDMVTVVAGQTSTSTMSVKKTLARMETSQQGQNVIMLMNGDTKTMYMYMPDQNMAIKMDYSQATKSAADNSSSALNYSPTVVGTETIDGKVCQVIQYTADGGTTKEWIWEAKGLPVRVQVTTSQGTTTTDFKNYDFSDIPDANFQLPAGVQISSLGLPPGVPSIPGAK